MLNETPPFVFEAPNGILSGRERGEELLDRLMDHMQSCEPDGVTPLDFSEIAFMDISCADEFLSKLLMRIGSGELGTRYAECTTSTSATASTRFFLNAPNSVGGNRINDFQTYEFVGQHLKRPTRASIRWR